MAITRKAIVTAVTITTTALVWPSAGSAADKSDESTVASIEVHYADLDLNSPTGLRTLHKRVNRATWRLCVRKLDLSGRLETLACRSKAMGGAITQVDFALARARRERQAANSVNALTPTHRPHE